MNECYKFFQNGPLFHKSLSHPKINTCQFFKISANFANLYKPVCYQRPHSASVMSLLSGFAAAVKCQVQMPWTIYTAAQQKKGQEMVKSWARTHVEWRHTVSDPQEHCFGIAVLAPAAFHHTRENHLYLPLTPNYSPTRSKTMYATWSYRPKRFILANLTKDKSKGRVQKSLLVSDR